MNLVVVESPSKAKTINKYLGKNYVVRASKGHVVDLPKSKIGIDVENNFEPQYEVTNQKSLSELKKLFKTSDELILAVDLDREGEAIGWHIAQELKLIDKNGKSKGKKPLKRIVFNEISKSAIDEAMKSPRSIDLNLVNAQQARRLLDRIVGYKLSPLLWKKISFGLSAGRVQSVALRLIVEREEERNKFISEEYWSLEAFVSLKETSNISISYHLSKSEKEDIEKIEKSDSLIKFELSKIAGKKPDLKNQSEVEKIVDNVKNAEWKIYSLDKSISKRNPKSPFITSTLQQAAVNRLSFTAKRAMRAAQKLYEAGLITYMRTDSVHMSDSATISAKKYVEKEFGSKYLSDKSLQYKSSNKSAQEAHECIRPVDFAKTSSILKLDGDEKRIYDLIWQRAIASVMQPAQVENISLTVLIDKYEFKSTGTRVVFDGYLKVFPEKISENMIPELEKETLLFPNSIEGVQHFTQPPARYSEASLIKKLEELGIGRPSTYASIISVIQDRKYVVNENRYLIPTDTGSVVNKMLVKYFEPVVNYGFTAEMEENLDKISEGKLDWKKMLKDFYFPFEKEVIKQDKLIPRSEFTELGKSDKKCPVCGKAMIIKLGRYGKFLSCVDYPKCKGMLSIDGKSESDLAAEAKSPEFMAKYELSPKAEDGREYLLKKGKYGEFWAHPDYPKVKDARPLVLRREALIEIYGEIPKTKDGKEYVLRKGKYGEFWAHPNYPEEKDIIRIKKKPQPESN
jgi:DNA topoisomerase I